MQPATKQTADKLIPTTCLMDSIDSFFPKPAGLLQPKVRVKNISIGNWVASVMRKRPTPLSQNVLNCCQAAFLEVTSRGNLFAVQTLSIRKEFLNSRKDYRSKCSSIMVDRVKMCSTALPDDGHLKGMAAEVSPKLCVFTEYIRVSSYAALALSLCSSRNMSASAGVVDGKLRPSLASERRVLAIPLPR